MSGFIRRLIAVGGVTLVVGTLGTPSAFAHRTHTLEPGESVWELARRHDVTVGAIVEANGLRDASRVVVGTTIEIPDPGSSAPSSARSGGAAGSTTGSSHTVRAGETLSEIAARTGSSTRAIAEANAIADVHRIRAGSRIAIPIAATAVVAAGTKVPTVAVGSGGYPARLQASPSRLALVPTFERWASTYGVPVDLLMAVTWLESGWQNGVVSPVGAVGIGQVMPDTVLWMEQVIIGEPLDPRDPGDNIRMSARYLRWLLDKFGGDSRLALAGYYQGAEAVRTRGVYPQTEQYVSDVLSFRSRHFSR